jgi:hypothetical protein
MSLGKIELADYGGRGGEVAMVEIVLFVVRYGPNPVDLFCRYNSILVMSMPALFGG